MKKALSIVRESVAGAQLKDSALVFTAKVPLDRLNMLARAISRMADSSPWWTGDIGLEIQRQKCGEYFDAHPAREEDVPGERDHGAEQAAGEYLAVRSAEDKINHGYRKNCMMICRFFDASFRNDALSFAHHIAAMMGAGGANGKMATAQQWLKKAEKNGWSAADLRREVNLALATHTPPKGDAEENPYNALDQADHWAMNHRDEEISPEAAGKLLTRFEALIAFFDKLRLAAVPH